MAKASIPDHFQSMSADDLHCYAHALLQEMGGETDKVFAVAAAGAHYAGEKDINARSLFQVIGGICEDATVSLSLEQVIDQLAKRAGSVMAPDQAKQQAAT